MGKRHDISQGAYMILAHFTMAAVCSSLAPILAKRKWFSKVSAHRESELGNLLISRDLSDANSKVSDTLHPNYFLKMDCEKNVTEFLYHEQSAL